MAHLIFQLFILYRIIFYFLFTQNPFIYTHHNVTSVLVYDKTYSLRHNDLLINNYVPLHLNQYVPAQYEMQETHTLDFSLHDLKEIKELTLPDRSFSSHRYIIYCTLGLTIIVLIVVIIMLKRSNKKHNKYIGHLYGLTKMSASSGSTDLSEKGSDKSDINLISYE